jgi:hypothetical protein
MAQSITATQENAVGSGFSAPANWLVRSRHSTRCQPASPTGGLPGGKGGRIQLLRHCSFGLTADEMATWIHFGGGQTLWDELSADFSVKGVLLLRSAGTTVEVRALLS